MTQTTAVSPEAPTWATELMAAWDQQQQGYLPRREERFTAIVDVVRTVGGSHAAVLDLGAGPGSTSDRILRALPGAVSVAVDTDPVLLALGEAAMSPRWGARLRFVDVDLRDDDVASRLTGETPAGGFDAVVSTTALHWLDIAALAQVYAVSHRLLRAGGVLLNGDEMAFTDSLPTVARLVSNQHDRDHAVSVATSGVLTWEDWWERAGTVPALAEAGALRRARQEAVAGRQHPRPEQGHSLDLHRALLAQAGFTEVQTVWQRLDDRVLLGVKP